MLFNALTELRVILFFFQAEDGIRDLTVTGVQTCALPISLPFSDLRRLAVAAAAQVGPGLGLLGNPRVRSSVELLTILRSVPRARELLFRLHAYAVARDQRADTASLEVIIDGLRRGGDHPDLAYLLVGNMTVQKNEPLR